MKLLTSSTPNPSPTLSHLGLRAHTTVLRKHCHHHVMARERLTVEVTLTLDEAHNMAWNHPDPEVRRTVRRALGQDYIDSFSWRRCFYILMCAWLCIWGWQNVHMYVRATIRGCWITYLLLMRVVRRSRKHTTAGR